MADTKKQNIMCVDDEQDVLDSLFDTFMDKYNVKTVNDSTKALELFKKEDFALVITDQRMPEMEGTELLAEIHKIKPICKKILLTGYADINAAIDAINLGSVDKYLSKPWDAAKLISDVEELLEEYKMDKFFDDAIGKTKDMKEEVAKGAANSVLLGKFLDSYLVGVCIVSEKEKVAYINKRGLSLLKYKDLSAVENKDIKDVFSINELNKKKFLEKYLKKDASRDRVNATLGDGSSSDIEVGVTFATGESGLKISGIVFG
ncbi:MAG: response regulator [Candidatus Anammoxibacter sp.]